MARHITDHGDREGGERTTPYTKIDRSKTPHPATEALQRRQPDSAAEDVRAAEYARIDRGETT